MQFNTLTWCLSGSRYGKLGSTFKRFLRENEADPKFTFLYGTT